LAPPARRASHAPLDPELAAKCSAENPAFAVPFTEAPIKGEKKYNFKKQTNKKKNKNERNERATTTHIHIPAARSWFTTFA